MFQRTQIIGRLGGNPEMRYTSKGTPVTTFPVAVDGRGEKTTWFRVTTWGKLAEVCNEYLGKGWLVFVEGEIAASAWTGKDGEPRATLELTAHTVKFLGGKGNGNRPSTQEAPEAVATPVPVREEAVSQTVPEPEPQAEPGAVDDLDFDDLPF